MLCAADLSLHQVRLTSAIDQRFMLRRDALKHMPPPSTVYGVVEQPRSQWNPLRLFQKNSHFSTCKCLYFAGTRPHLPPTHIGLRAQRTINDSTHVGQTMSRHFCAPNQVRYRAIALTRAYTRRIVRRLCRWPYPLLCASRPSVCGGPRRSLQLCRVHTLRTRPVGRGGVYPCWWALDQISLSYLARWRAQP